MRRFAGTDAAVAVIVAACIVVAGCAVRQVQLDDTATVCDDVANADCAPDTNVTIWEDEGNAG